MVAGKWRKHSMMPGSHKHTQLQILSHDLRKPMQLMKMFASTIERCENLDEVKKLAQVLRPEIDTALKRVEERLKKFACHPLTAAQR